MPCGLNIFLKRKLTRKEFLEALARDTVCILGFATAFSPVYAVEGLVTDKPHKQERLSLSDAKYYKRLDGEKVQCLLCPHQCIVPNGERGECGVRENREGAYYTLTYGRPCALHVDPVEKKPLFHVLPGSKAFSLAAAGCNLNCLFCQNWQISQALPEEVSFEEVSPAGIVDMAKRAGCRMIAYTYSEPTVFFEYMLEIAEKAHKEGLLNTCHSNGYINPSPLNELLRFMDAANIDLKGFTEAYYRDMCGGELKPVLQSLKHIRQMDVHLELTNLVVPTKNDESKKIGDMCRWVKKELGADVPVHFSRFYPRYKLQNLPPTPLKTMERSRDIAMEEGLEYVYIGNLKPGHQAENTYCPNCKKKIIERRGYSVKKIELKSGKCRYCDHDLPGIWN